MILLLPLTLLLFSLGPFPYNNAPFASAGDVAYNHSCNVNNQRLQIGTYQFTTDCNSMTFCNSSSFCDWKGCRRDDYPFGYSGSVPIPNKCGPGFFCPDEEDGCQELLAVGSPCQFNRDDECQPPPNWKELADHTGFGLNSNGSVCLNNVCMWANMTLGQPCVVENTAYIVYAGNDEGIDIVSRGNCKIGLYCDSSQKVCMNTKAIGDTCDADKECSTFNCLDTGVCGKVASTPKHVPFWVYIVVGVCIFGGMFATLVSLYFVHKRQRNVEREKRMQYWREQNAFRQNIIQMQESARHSLMSLNGQSSPRSTVYGMNSEESQIPMLNAQSKSSALRHQFSDNDLNGSEESIVVKRKEQSRF